MVDAVGVSPVEVLKELGDFAWKIYRICGVGSATRTRRSWLLRGAWGTCEPRSAPAKRRGQRLFVRSTSCHFPPPLNGQKLCLKVRPGDTVLSLKQKIRDSKNIPLERQCLIIRGRQLMDGKRLYESNVFDGATVQLCV